MYVCDVRDISRTITFLTIICCEPVVTFNYFLYISIMIFVITSVSGLDIRFSRLLGDFLSGKSSKTSSCFELSLESLLDRNFHNCSCCTYEYGKCTSS